MKIENTSLEGVYIITPDIHKDKRGCFYETYNEKLFFSYGLNAKFVQDDVSLSYKGVLKGLHGDSGTYKLIQCSYGNIYEVVVNCDCNSKNFGKWESFILNDENRKMIYIPPMYGNGYYVLSDLAVYNYKQSTYYGEYKQFTFKWNDERFNIDWPIDNLIISERDK